MMDVEMAEGIGRLSPGAAELCLIEQGGGFAPMASGPRATGIRWSRAAAVSR